ncbi:hypothetical protein CRYPD_55 [uncultured Candidatus Thioglobus sp.]|nr:hypothetical protein CRYPD_55 [uncultured Candidatus Thioglobus sp.]
MDSSDFKNQLNAFLINTGISKNALAKTVNISQSQISNWSNYGLKRWTKNSKILDEFIKEYNQNNLPIPEKIQQSLRHILAKNTEGEAEILSILEAINSLTKEGK